MSILISSERSGFERFCVVDFSFFTDGGTLKESDTSDHRLHGNKGSNMTSNFFSGGCSGWLL